MQMTHKFVRGRNSLTIPISVRESFLNTKQSSTTIEVYLDYFHVKSKHKILSLIDPMNDSSSLP